MTADAIHPAAEIFREWLNRGQAGCKFASQLASAKPRLAYYVGLRPIASESHETITAHVQQAARDGLVAVALFPRARCERDAAVLVNLLAKSPHWQFRTKALPVNDEERPGIVGVTLCLQTAANATSYAMGFAPSGQMPTTRRGPYLGLALWAGERSNPYFDGGPAGTVNLAHAPHGLKRAGHDSMWSASAAATTTLLAEPPDDGRWLRDVAFCLPTDWLVGRHTGAG